MKRENIARGRTVQQYLESLEGKRTKLAAVDKIELSVSYVGSIAATLSIGEAVRALLLVDLDEQIATLAAELEAL